MGVKNLFPGLDDYMGLCYTSRNHIPIPPISARDLIDAAEKCIKRREKNKPRNPNEDYLFANQPELPSSDFHLTGRFAVHPSEKDVEYINHPPYEQDVRKSSKYPPRKFYDVWNHDEEADFFYAQGYRSIHASFPEPLKFLGAEFKVMFDACRPDPRFFFPPGSDVEMQTDRLINHYMRSKERYKAYVKDLQPQHSLSGKITKMPQPPVYLLFFMHHMGLHIPGFVDCYQTESGKYLLHNGYFNYTFGLIGEGQFPKWTVKERLIFFYLTMRGYHELEWRVNKRLNAGGSQSEDVFPNYSPTPNEANEKRSKEMNGLGRQTVSGISSRPYLNLSVNSGVLRLNLFGTDETTFISRFKDCLLVKNNEKFNADEIEIYVNLDYVQYTTNLVKKKVISVRNPPNLHDPPEDLSDHTKIPVLFGSILPPENPGHHSRIREEDVETAETAAAKQQSDLDTCGEARDDKAVDISPLNRNVYYRTPTKYLFNGVSMQESQLVDRGPYKNSISKPIVAHSPGRRTVYTIMDPSNALSATPPPILLPQQHPARNCAASSPPGPSTAAPYRVSPFVFASPMETTPMLSPQRRFRVISPQKSLVLPQYNKSEPIHLPPSSTTPSTSAGTRPGRPYNFKRVDHGKIIKARCIPTSTEAMMAWNGDRRIERPSHPDGRFQTCKIADPAAKSAPRSYRPPSIQQAGQGAILPGRVAQSVQRIPAPANALHRTVIPRSAANPPYLIGTPSSVKFLVPVDVNAPTNAPAVSAAGISTVNNGNERPSAEAQDDEPLVLDETDPLQSDTQQTGDKILVFPSEDIADFLVMIHATNGKQQAEPEKENETPEKPKKKRGRPRNEDRLPEITAVDPVSEEERKKRQQSTRTRFCNKQPEFQGLPNPTKVRDPANPKPRRIPLRVYIAHLRGGPPAVRTRGRPKRKVYARGKQGAHNARIITAIQQKAGMIGQILNQEVMEQLCAEGQRLNITMTYGDPKGDKKKSCQNLCPTLHVQSKKKTSQTTTDSIPEEASKVNTNKVDGSKVKKNKNKKKKTSILMTGRQPRIRAPRYDNWDGLWPSSRLTALKNWLLEEIDFGGFGSFKVPLPTITDPYDPNNLWNAAPISSAKYAKDVAAAPDSYVWEDYDPVAERYRREEDERLRDLDIRRLSFEPVPEEIPDQDEHMPEPGPSTPTEPEKEGAEPYWEAPPMDNYENAAPVDTETHSKLDFSRPIEVHRVHVAFDPAPHVAAELEKQIEAEHSEQGMTSDITKKAFNRPLYSRIFKKCNTSQKEFLKNRPPPKVLPRALQLKLKPMLHIQRRGVLSRLDVHQRKEGALDTSLKEEQKKFLKDIERTLKDICKQVAKDVTQPVEVLPLDEGRKPKETLGLPEATLEAVPEVMQELKEVAEVVEAMVSFVEKEALVPASLVEEAAELVNAAILEKEIVSLEMVSAPEEMFLEEQQAVAFEEEAPKEVAETIAEPELSASPQPVAIVETAAPFKEIFVHTLERTEEMLSVPLNEVVSKKVAATERVESPLSVPMIVSQAESIVDAVQSVAEFFAIKEGALQSLPIAEASATLEEPSTVCEQVIAPEVLTIAVEEVPSTIVAAQSPEVDVTKDLAVPAVSEVATASDESVKTEIRAIPITKEFPTSALDKEVIAATSEVSPVALPPSTVQDTEALVPVEDDSAHEERDLHIQELLTEMLSDENINKQPELAHAALSILYAESEGIPSASTSKELFKDAEPAVSPTPEEPALEGDDSEDREDRRTLKQVEQEAEIENVAIAKNLNEEQAVEQPLSETRKRHLCGEDTEQSEEPGATPLRKRIFSATDSSAPYPVRPVEALLDTEAEHVLAAIEPIAKAAETQVQPTTSDSAIAIAEEEAVTDTDDDIDLDVKPRAPMKAYKDHEFPMQPYVERGYQPTPFMNPSQPLARTLQRGYDGSELYDDRELPLPQSSRFIQNMHSVHDNMGASQPGYPQYPPVQQQRVMGATVQDAWGQQIQGLQGQQGLPPLTLSATPYNMPPQVQHPQGNGAYPMHSSHVNVAQTQWAMYPQPQPQQMYPPQAYQQSFPQYTQGNFFYSHHPPPQQHIQFNRGQPYIHPVLGAPIHPGTLMRFGPNDTPVPMRASLGSQTMAAPAPGTQVTMGASSGSQMAMAAPATPKHISQPATPMSVAPPATPMAHPSTPITAPFVQQQPVELVPNIYATPNHERTSRPTTATGALTEALMIKPLSGNHTSVFQEPLPFWQMVDNCHAEVIKNNILKDERLRITIDMSKLLAVKDFQPARAENVKRMTSSKPNHFKGLPANFKDYVNCDVSKEQQKVLDKVRNLIAQGAMALAKEGVNWHVWGEVFSESMMVHTVFNVYQSLQYPENHRIEGTAMAVKTRKLRRSLELILEAMNHDYQQEGDSPKNMASTHPSAAVFPYLLPALCEQIQGECIRKENIKVPIPLNSTNELYTQTYGHPTRDTRTLRDYIRIFLNNIPTKENIPGDDDRCVLINFAVVATDGSAPGRGRKRKDHFVGCHQFIILSEKLHTRTGDATVIKMGPFAPIRLAHTEETESVKLCTLDRRNSVAELDTSKKGIGFIYCDKLYPEENQQYASFICNSPSWEVHFEQVEQPLPMAEVAFSRPLLDQTPALHMEPPVAYQQQWQPIITQEPEQVIPQLQKLFEPPVPQPDEAHQSRETESVLVQGPLAAVEEDLRQELSPVEEPAPEVAPEPAVEHTEEISPTQPTVEQELQHEPEVVLQEEAECVTEAELVVALPQEAEPALEEDHEPVLEEQPTQVLEEKPVVEQASTAVEQEHEPLLREESETTPEKEQEAVIQEEPVEVLELESIPEQREQPKALFVPESVLEPETVPEQEEESKTLIIPEPMSEHALEPENVADVEMEEEPAAASEKELEQVEEPLPVDRAPNADKLIVALRHPWHELITPGAMGTMTLNMPLPPSDVSRFDRNDMDLAKALLPHPTLKATESHNPWNKIYDMTRPISVEEQMAQSQKEKQILQIIHQIRVCYGKNKNHFLALENFLRPNFGTIHSPLREIITAQNFFSATWKYLTLYGIADCAKKICTPSRIANWIVQNVGDNVKDSLEQIHKFTQQNFTISEIEQYNKCAAQRLEKMKADKVKDDMIAHVSMESAFAIMSKLYIAPDILKKVNRLIPKRTPTEQYQAQAEHIPRWNCNYTENATAVNDLNISIPMNLSVAEMELCDMSLEDKVKYFADKIAEGDPTIADGLKTEILENVKKMKPLIRNTCRQAPLENKSQAVRDACLYLLMQEQMGFMEDSAAKIILQTITKMNEFYQRMAATQSISKAAREQLIFDFNPASYGPKIVRYEPPEGVTETQIAKKTTEDDDFDDDDELLGDEERRGGKRRASTNGSGDTSGVEPRPKMQNLGPSTSYRTAQGPQFYPPSLPSIRSGQQWDKESIISQDSGFGGSCPSIISKTSAKRKYSSTKEKETITTKTTLELETAGLTTDMCPDIRTPVEEVLRVAPVDNAPLLLKYLAAPFAASPRSTTSSGSRDSSQPPLKRPTPSASKRPTPLATPTSTTMDPLSVVIPTERRHSHMFDTLLDVATREFRDSRSGSEDVDGEVLDLSMKKNPTPSPLASNRPTPLATPTTAENQTTLLIPHTKEIEKRQLLHQQVAEPQQKTLLQLELEHLDRQLQLEQQHLQQHFRQLEEQRQKRLQPPQLPQPSQLLLPNIIGLKAEKRPAKTLTVLGISPADQDLVAERALPRKPNTFEFHFFNRNRYTVEKNWVEGTVILGKSMRAGRGKKAHCPPTAEAKQVHKMFLTGKTELKLILKGAKLDFFEMEKQWDLDHANAQPAFQCISTDMLVLPKSLRAISPVMTPQPTTSTWNSRVNALQPSPEISKQYVAANPPMQLIERPRIITKAALKELPPPRSVQPLPCEQRLASEVTEDKPTVTEEPIFVAEEASVVDEEPVMEEGAAPVMGDEEENAIPVVEEDEVEPVTDEEEEQTYQALPLADSLVDKDGQEQGYDEEEVDVDDEEEVEIDNEGEEEYVYEDEYVEEEPEVVVLNEGWEEGDMSPSSSSLSVMEEVPSPTPDFIDVVGSSPQPSTSQTAASEKLVFEEDQEESDEESTVDVLNQDDEGVEVDIEFNEEEDEELGRLVIDETSPLPTADYAMSPLHLNATISKLKVQLLAENETIQEEEIIPEPSPSVIVETPGQIVPEPHRTTRFLTEDILKDKYTKRAEIRRKEVYHFHRIPKIPLQEPFVHFHFDRIRRTVFTAEHERRRLMTTTACEQAYKHLHPKSSLLQNFPMRRAQSVDSFFGRRVDEHFGEHFVFAEQRMCLEDLNLYPLVTQNIFGTILSRCNTPATVAPFHEYDTAEQRSFAYRTKIPLSGEKLYRSSFEFERENKDLFSDDSDDDSTEPYDETMSLEDEEGTSYDSDSAEFESAEGAAESLTWGEDEESSAYEGSSRETSSPEDNGDPSPYEENLGSSTPQTLSGYETASAGASGESVSLENNVETLSLQDNAESLSPDNEEFLTE